MKLLKFVHFYIMIVTIVVGRRRLSPMHIRALKEEQAKVLRKDPEQGPMMCARLSKEPYFSVEMLLGRAWRIYYSWNMDLHNHCMDMIFRNATPAIIRRIFNSMNEYLDADLYWEAATVLVTMGRERHEMLLFSDQEAIGRFKGVPNLIKEGDMIPSRMMVPLLRFHLKLMYGGKYLLMSDCQLGVTTLSARRGSKPYRAEIGGIADNLNFGPGIQACMPDHDNVPKK